MDDLREVAKAYHGRATNEEKKITKKYFRSLDSNGDGKISRADIKSDPALQTFTDDSLFDCLDENNNGTLDFEEFLTLDYMRRCGMRWCKGCSDWLIGSYFSCWECEQNVPATYDICCSCYAGGKFTHHHSTESFLDSHSIRLVLGRFVKEALQEKVAREAALIKAAQENEKMKQINAQQLVSRSKSKREMGEKVLDAVVVGTKIGNAVVVVEHIADALDCSVM